MNLARTLYIAITYPQRLRHRLGYGVQSPFAYELVRDVLFERLHYYAYKDLNLRSEADRQLWRLRNHFTPQHLVHIDSSAADAHHIYEQTANSATAHTALVIDGLAGTNAHLWTTVLHDPRATVTFDLGTRGLVTFDSKRIKQNYIL